MAVTIGKTGLVTSWGGTVNTALLARFSPMRFRIDIDGDQIDITEYAASLVPRNFMSGLRGWSVTMEGFAATATNGTVGNVTGTDYATNLNAWNMDIQCTAVPTTNWTDLSGGWRTFAPGLQQWGGGFEGFPDSTTAITPASEYATSDDASAVFTMSSTNTLTGTIRYASTGLTSDVGGNNTVAYRYFGKNHLTIAGTDALLAANTGTMVDMAAGELILQTASSRTYTGNAFPTSIAVSTRLGDATRIVIRAQGTGALTIA